MTERFVTVVAEWQYQAFERARKALQSNVALVDGGPSDGSMREYTFRAVDTEAWPVAARHYREQARANLAAARARRLAGDKAGALLLLMWASRNRVALRAAKTGLPRGN